LSVNTCGDCNVCCEVMGFTGEWAEFDRYKEAEKYGVVFDVWEDCNKLCDNKCTIWNDKPRICDEFNCYYITEELIDKYKPNEFGFVIYESQDKKDVFCISTDKTLPPEIQYLNNKKNLDELIGEVEVSVGRIRPVILITKQGNLVIRGKGL